MTACFFAMFDILGFTNLLRERGTDGLYQQYSRNILTMLQHAAMPQFITEVRNGQNVSRPDPKSQRVYYRFVSDTIMYWTPDDSADSFFKIVFSSLELLKAGFGGLYAPYRGAIGYGDIISDQVGILLGSSIIDAYKGEQSQVWSGCIVTENCEKLCEERGYFLAFENLFKFAMQGEENADKIVNYKKAQRSLVRYPVPLQMKHTEKPIDYLIKELYVLDWTHKVYIGAAAKSFRQSTVLHQQMIRQNTIDFENWARENNAIK